jgi:hypothetical protein
MPREARERASYTKREMFLNGTLKTTKGYKHTKEAKVKMALVAKGRKPAIRTKEWNAKISAAKKGVPSPLRGTKRS